MMPSAKVWLSHILVWMLRTLAGFLALLLFGLTFAALALLQMKSTILRADYYAGPLAESSFYEFLMTDAMRSAIDEALGDDAIPDSLDISNIRLAESVSSVFPPDWVRVKAEQLLSEAGGYAMGERERFGVTIHVEDRADALASELKALTNESNVADFLIEEAIGPSVSDLVVDALPADAGISRSQIDASTRNILPPEWLELQAEAAITETIPYFVGREGGFLLNIPIQDRVETAMGELKSLLRNSNAYDLLYRDLAAHRVEARMGGPIELPYGIVITTDEVSEALQEVATPDWFQESLERVIDDATPFITGRETGFASIIDLVENKRKAVSVIEEIAHRKLDERLETLPVCRQNRPAQLRMLFQGELSCAPGAVNVEEASDRIASLLGEGAASWMEENVPDTIAITQDDLYQSVGRANEDIVDTVRAYSQDGWTYTESDLRRDLPETFPRLEDPVATLDSVRDLVSRGWTYTDIDLRKSMTPWKRYKLHDDRNTLNLLRTLAWPAAVSTLLMTAAVGFVGGRNWRSRTIWAFGTLAGSSLLTLASISLFSDLFLQPYLNDTLIRLTSDIFDGVHLPRTEALVAAKVSDIAGIAANDFRVGVIINALVVSAIAILPAGVAIAWPHIQESVERWRDAR